MQLIIDTNTLDSVKAQKIIKILEIIIEEDLDEYDINLTSKCEESGIELQATKNEVPSGPKKRGRKPKYHNIGISTAIPPKISLSPESLPVPPLTPPPPPPAEIIPEITFDTIIMEIGELIGLGKITKADMPRILKMFGVESLPLLQENPNLFKPVYEKLQELR